MPRAAIYVRKSTESDDRQCLSLPAQLDWAHAAAARLGLDEPLLFAESRSAKTPGRPEFNRLVEKIERGEIDTILCWKADRLARNALDGGRILYALETRKLARIVTADRTYFGQADEEFILQIELGLSAKYSKDLSANVRRGLAAKWKRGEWSFAAPFGYRNVRLSADRSVIEVDPAAAPYVRRLFALAGTGDYSLVRLADIVRDEWGIALRSGRCVRTKRGVSQSAIYKILRNPFYYGVMRVKGELYAGSHSPLISRALFDLVQIVLATRRKTAERPHRRAFAFNGILRCGGCGRQLSGYAKTKNGRTYVYYVCSRHLQRTCTQPQLSERDVMASVLQILDVVSCVPREIEHVVGMLRLVADSATEDHALLAARQGADIRKLDQADQKLLDLLLADVITRAEYGEKKREIQTRREALSPNNLGDSAADRQQEFELASSFIGGLLHAGTLFRQADAAEKRTILRKLGFELEARGKEALVHAGKPALILANRQGHSLNWGVVEEIWNCFGVRRRLANVLVPQLRKFRL